jgi:hypothetical protein
MDRENHLESVRQQYADEIREAYIECEHGYSENRVNIDELTQRLSTLMENAKVEGLPDVEFEELVVATLPEVYDKIQLKRAPSKARKKAA